MDIQATSLNRVIACNGSVAMERSPAAIATPTEDAQEGTAAHYLAAAVLSGAINDVTDMVGKSTPNGIFVTDDMAQHVAKFTDHIMSRGYESAAEIHVEASTDFEISGTNVVIRARPDLIAFDPGTKTLYVDDLKYGWRLVEPERNWVLIAYALSACFRWHWIPLRIVMTIHQPRPFHPGGQVREWSIGYDELLQLWAYMYGALAKLDNDLHTGSHCHKCKALAICSAARLAGLNSVEASSIVFNDEIPNEALAFEIDNLRRAKAMLDMRLDAIEDLAKHRIKSGDAVGDWAVEMSFGNRTWQKGTTAEMLVAMTGQPVDKLTTSKLATPAAVERLGVATEVVAAISYRPPTTEKLVRSDPTRRANKLFAST